MFNQTSILISLWLTKKCPIFRFFYKKPPKNPKNSMLNVFPFTWLIVFPCLCGIDGGAIMYVWGISVRWRSGNCDIPLAEATGALWIEGDCPQHCPGFIQPIMEDSLGKLLSNVRRLEPKHMANTPQTHPTLIPHSSHTHPKHILNMSQAYPKFMPNSPNTHPKWTQDRHRT